MKKLISLQNVFTMIPLVQRTADIYEDQATNGAALIKTRDSFLLNQHALQMFITGLNFHIFNDMGDVISEQITPAEYFDSEKERFQVYLCVECSFYTDTKKYHCDVVLRESFEHTETAPDSHRLWELSREIQEKLQKFLDN